MKKSLLVELIGCVVSVIGLGGIAASGFMEARDNKKEDTDEIVEVVTTEE